MTLAHHIDATHVPSRKRPFRPRKRVLSARTNSKPVQPVAMGPGEVEPGLHEKKSRMSKGGAPRGNQNRFVHGRYTRERRALYAAIRAHIREGRELIAWARLVLAERAMGAALERCVQPPPCGGSQRQRANDARSEASTSGGGRSLAPSPHPKNPSDFSTSPQRGRLFFVPLPQQRIDRARAVRLGAFAAAGLGAVAPGGDVEMHPGLGLGDEAVEEQRRGDRARIAVVGIVVEIGDAARSTRSHSRATSGRRHIGSCVAFEWRIRSEASVSSSVKKGGSSKPVATRAAPVSVAMSIRSSGASLSASAQRVGEHEASFGIGVADLDRQALAAREHVARAIGVAGDRILDRRDQARAGAHRASRPSPCRRWRAPWPRRPCPSSSTACRTTGLRS